MTVLLNEWCIYTALYWVLLYTQSALQSCGGGGSLLNHHQCAASSTFVVNVSEYLTHISEYDDELFDTLTFDKVKHTTSQNLFFFDFLHIL